LQAHYSSLVLLSNAEFCKIYKEPKCSWKCNSYYRILLLIAGSKTPSCEIVTSLAYTRDPLRVRPQDASCETSRGSQTQPLRAFDLSVRSAELRKFSIVQDTLCTTSVSARLALRSLRTIQLVRDPLRTILYRTRLALYDVQLVQDSLCANRGPSRQFSVRLALRFTWDYSH